MIRKDINEDWKDLQLEEGLYTKKKNRISNQGRVISVEENGKTHLLKTTPTNGYPMMNAYQKSNGKKSGRYVHKLVAQHFLERKEDEVYVIHLNYDKLDNRVENLKWATKREKELHQFSGPAHINRKPRLHSAKLTEARVRLIKRKINDPNRKTRMKMIAKQFGVSEMQLYRIKSGENWGHVTDY
ncbi:HNH endonuclease [Flavicella sp.]|uniref:HNH endonuclease n=1 Tax=Flavicella sp. TaxID=2957742 RepID=UPI002629F6BB|nr:HNH endonuclease [Flavicella sp.]MDG1804547.1 HNH endonuclease [Flavicella sp.]